jgi:hypothetical protein
MKLILEINCYHDYGSTYYFKELHDTSKMWDGGNRWNEFTNQDFLVVYKYFDDFAEKIIQKAREQENEFIKLFKTNDCDTILIDSEMHEDIIFDGNIVIGEDE